MSVTTTKAEVLKDVLDNADGNRLPAALQMVKLGTLLTPIVKDTGVISAVAAITLSPPALLVQSARVVSSGTAGSVGSYLVADSAATRSTPTTASNQAGVATISADGATLTFPNTVTQAVIQYIPRPDTALTANFKRA